MLLDSNSVLADNILLLDTFFDVMVHHGMVCDCPAKNKDRDARACAYAHARATQYSEVQDPQELGDGEGYRRLLRWWRVMEGLEDFSRLCKDVEA